MNQDQLKRVIAEDEFGLLDPRHRAPTITPLSQAVQGSQSLPKAAGLVAYTKNRRGETVYLEESRWSGHIVPNHITQPPEARGKRTTTWWPVMHSATNQPTMLPQDVLDATITAARDGDWHNAPRGTRIAIFSVPEEMARRWQVTEIKVSAAPDGRILSAYPTAGPNVKSMREHDA